MAASGSPEPSPAPALAQLGCFQPNPKPPVLTKLLQCPKGPCGVLPVGRDPGGSHLPNYLQVPFILRGGAGASTEQGLEGKGWCWDVRSPSLLIPTSWQVLRAFIPQFLLLNPL